MHLQLSNYSSPISVTNSENNKNNMAVAISNVVPVSAVDIKEVDTLSQRRKKYKRRFKILYSTIRVH